MGVLVAPANIGLDSGFGPVFPNIPVVGVVDEAPAAGVLLPPKFPKEKLGVPVEPPKRPPDEVGVEEPNKPPGAGALDVVALLDWAVVFGLPKSDDIVWLGMYTAWFSGWKGMD